MSEPPDTIKQVPRFHVTFPLTPCIEPNETHRQSSKAITSKYAALPATQPLVQDNSPRWRESVPALIASDPCLAPSAVRERMPHKILPQHLAKVCSKKTQQALRAELALPLLTCAGVRPKRSLQELVCSRSGGTVFEKERRRQKATLEVPVMEGGVSQQVRTSLKPHSLRISTKSLPCVLSCSWSLQMSSPSSYNSSRRPYLM